MRFLIDNAISYRIALSLAPLVEVDGHEVVALRAKFSPDEADRVWLPRLRQEDHRWVIITADLGRKDGDRQAWLTSGLTVFFLANAWSSGAFKLTDISQRLLKYWPRIAETASTCRPGSCFDVGIQGRITKARLK